MISLTVLGALGLAHLLQGRKDVAKLTFLCVLWAMQKKVDITTYEYESRHFYSITQIVRLRLLVSACCFCHLYFTLAVKSTRSCIDCRADIVFPVLRVKLLHMPPVVQQ
ncbi:hypothetical protein POTOM_061066 [Populus tomentosa]|uniref:Secreted protein n=1 Tax=Populus tomentosa TaxID=118781 RepID=A0A8X8BVK7_POPTO|nr:hypothetical protein POTOM_061066 [Populus tomentosa]